MSQDILIRRGCGPRAPRIFLSLVSILALILLPMFTAAQEPHKAHLGYLSPGDIPRYDNAFLQGLQDEGYILPGEIPRYDEALWHTLVKQGFFDGKKIRVDIRSSAEHYPESALGLAGELVRLNVDVIYAATPPEAKAAQIAVERANKATPIIFGPHSDPVGAHVVTSLARPGGNMTGLTIEDPELVGKLVEILKETFPRLATVAYVYEPTMYPSALRLRARQAAKTAARAAGMRLVTFEVRKPEDIETALTTVARRHTQGIVLRAGPLTLAARRRVVDFTVERRLPAIYEEALFVEEGGLMSYGAPFAERTRHSAAVVAKVLEGGKPADIPVEQPTRYQLLINSRTTEALGFTIPESILLRADEVIR